MQFCSANKAAGRGPTQAKNMDARWASMDAHALQGLQGTIACLIGWLLNAELLVLWAAARLARPTPKGQPALAAAAAERGSRPEHAPTSIGLVMAEDQVEPDLAASLVGW